MQWSYGEMSKGKCWGVTPDMGGELGGLRWGDGPYLHSPNIWKTCYTKFMIWPAKGVCPLSSKAKYIRNDRMTKKGHQEFRVEKWNFLSGEHLRKLKLTVEYSNSNLQLSVQTQTYSWVFKTETDSTQTYTHREHEACIRKSTWATWKSEEPRALLTRTGLIGIN